MTESAVVDVSLRILGPLEVEGLPDALSPGAAKERCLLAVLAVHAGDVVTQDRLVEALWGGEPPRSAVNALQNYVLRLRRALQPADAVRVVTRPGGYLLEVPDDAVDARRAERLIAEGRQAAEAGDPATAAVLLRKALGLWRGPALEEFADQQFARAEAARLDDLRESAREDLADAELALGHHHEVDGELRAMVAEQPLRERRWGQLMLALYRDGRQAEALDAFRTVRRTLADELGIEPGPELQELHDRILRQDHSLNWRPAGPAPALARCFGRDDELRQLLDTFGQAALGHGRVVLVVGEPGIGKSRLLHELEAAAARRGAVTLYGRCLEGAWAPPYAPLAEAIAGHAGAVDPARLRADLGTVAGPLTKLVPRLREILPDLPGPEPLQPDEERLRLLDAVRRFLAGLTARAPVLLVLDDLHWADASTLVTLRHVARFADRYPLLVAGAYRSTEAGKDLVDTLGAVRAEAEVTTVHLHGLDAGAIGRLVSEAAGGPVAVSVATWITDETGGNPFFAREIIRHLLEERALRANGDGRLSTDLPLAAVPEGVRQVLARRRARLSPGANDLLDSASGFEGPFPFSVAATVAGLGESAALSALDETLAAGLVEPDVEPDRYRFGHALVRSGVYEELNPSRRVRLHRQLAEALEASRARSPRLVAAAEVAGQYLRSAALPGAEAGVASAVEAADEAEASGAHDEAVDFLEIACRLAAPGDERLPRLRARLGLALAWARRFDEAVDVAREAAGRLASVEKPEAAAEYLLAVGRALSSGDSAPHAWELAAQGLTYLGSRHDATWAELTLLDLDRREAADPRFPGMLLDAPGRREALRILHDAEELTGRADLLRYAVGAIYGSRDNVPDSAAADATVRLFVLGDYAGALPMFEADAAEAHRRGQLARVAYCRGAAARCHVALGQLDAGRAGLAETRRLQDRIASGPWGWQQTHAIVGTMDALALATNAGWEELLALFADLSAKRSPGTRWAQSSFDAAAARAAAHVGQPDLALRLLAAVLPALQRAPAWALNYLRTACDAAETLWVLDRRDDLPVMEAALREKALVADFRWPMMDARLALARLCALDGRLDEASRWFGQARKVLDDQRARPLRAIADFDEALMHVRSGNTRAGRPLLDAAVGQFKDIGMAGWVRRAGEVGVRA